MISHYGRCFNVYEIEGQYYMGIALLPLLVFTYVIGARSYSVTFSWLTFSYTIAWGADSAT